MKKSYSSRLKNRFFGLIFTSFILTGNAWAGPLSATVDRTQLSENETLTLTIRCDTSVLSGSPDLAGLDSNFDIVSSNTSSQTNIINGSVTSTKEWRYTLLPKHGGKLLIPSFKLKGNFSDAIEIDVVAAGTRAHPNNSSDNNNELFVEQTVDKKEAYVGEHITLTRRLYTAVSINRPEIPDPVFADFSVEKIGEAEYQTRQNNLEYHILEYQYALYANKSGVLNLPKQRFTVNQLVNSNTTGPFGFPGLTMQAAEPRYLSTPEQTLTIKARPENVAVNQWLPSDDVSISDNWPEKQSVDVGTSLTRTIEFKALGNPAAQIPPLATPAVKGLKMYAEQPELTNNRAGSNLLGIRKETMAIVPVEPGSYTLPEITLHWWSIREKQFKTTTLPARTLMVSGSVALAPSSGTTATNSPAQQQDQSSQNWVNNPSESANTLVVNKATPFYLNVYLWMATSFVLCIAWLLTAYILLKRKKLPSMAATSSAQSIQQQKQKESFKQLKIACTANDARKARELLLAWSQQQWPGTDIHTLPDLKSRLNDKTFSQLVDELNAGIYRSVSGAGESWNGKNLLDFLQAAKWDKPGNPKEAVLPGLYG